MTTDGLPTLSDLIELVHKRSTDRTVLGRITVAEDLSLDLQEMADRLTDHFVQQARSAGNSWAQIGTQLGVSKQGAQQRYLNAREGEDNMAAQLLAEEPDPREPIRGSMPKGPMKRLKGALKLQRFTEDARTAVKAAQLEARELHHDHIGPEHVLLGILAAGGPGAKALNSLNMTLESVRDRVRSEIGQGSHSGSGHLPFTKDAKVVLELSLREALRLGHNYIGSEHILLGLVRSDNLATGLLEDMGATPKQIRGVVEKG